jgi:dCMP deaminase
MPNGCCDDDMPWERSAESQLDTKYPYVCHAELNAILNGATRDYTGCTLYVTLFPCNECTKAVIQSGIKKIVYLDNKYADTDSVKASVFMLEKCGIEFVQYKPIGRTLMFEV